MPSRCLAPEHPGYPEALLALASPPTLYVRGELPKLPGVAIVGARRARLDALRLAAVLARDLAAERLAIWSGGAVGVDAAAHEAALDAGAVTVAVAGGGLDHPYPRKHAPLYARILAQGGALVACVPDDVRPFPPLFLARNAVLAALTCATVVVEATVASGARSTASAARRLGRPLLVVPQAPWDELGAGCAAELVQGGATAIACAAHVLDVIRGPARAPSARAPGAPFDRAVGAAERAAAASRVSPPLARDARVVQTVGARVSGPSLAPPAPAGGACARGTLNAAESAVLAVLAGEPRHVDDVCEAASLHPRAATEALLTLTLGAVVVEGPAGFYRRVRRSWEASSPADGTEPTSADELVER